MYLQDFTNPSCGIKEVTLLAPIQYIKLLKKKQ